MTRVIVPITVLARSSIALVLLRLVGSWSGGGRNSDTLGAFLISCSCRFSYFWFLLPIPRARAPLLCALLLLFLLLLSLSLFLGLVWCRANELERLTNVGVTGADGTAGETSAARELHAALRDVRDGLINAQKLWRGAEEAADKCQVRGPLVVVVVVVLVVVGGWRGCLFFYFCLCSCSVCIWSIYTYTLYYRCGVGGWMGFCIGCCCVAFGVVLSVVFHRNVCM